MSNIIIDLRNGNLEPTNNFGKNNTKLQSYELKVQEKYEILFKSLNGDNQKLLENYVSIADKYQIMCEEQSFHDGFCLGMKIAAEAFMGSEEILE